MPQVKKDEVQEMILDAAETVFRTNGYSGTYMSSVADACGFSVGNLYRYYETKQELFEAVVDRVDDHTALVLMRAMYLDNPENLIKYLSGLTIDELTDIGGEIE